MRKHVIAYLHSHWDREWYREFEIFRLRLLRVFDNVLELLSKGKIPSFYFDGQVCALEDYLAMRPEKTELVEGLIRHKKLFIGPFYCLTDEFLTDKTCFSKNLEIGIKIAEKYGCTDFIGYLPDTFGHSQNVADILRNYGIDKCVVWRGCDDDIPCEFKWCGIDTVNLVRGYFNDIFSIKADIKTKAEILKKNLDLISEKSSGKYLLLPIGADHLGIETNIAEQISAVNEILKEDYYITLSSPFDYFKRVENNFSQYIKDDELRDNSRTFTLQGCYSSRLDLKRLNVECTYKLDLVSRLVKQQNVSSYDSVIEYAYKMLLQNQAHDSICGCSTDDVHKENKIRYQKILQIADGIIDEIKFKNNFNQKRILNLSGKAFSGMVEFESSAQIDECEVISVKKGFDKYLLADTQRIPITEDYNNIYTYVTPVSNVQPYETEYIMPYYIKSDLRVSLEGIENNKISFEVAHNKMFINGIEVSLKDYKDVGDSYNSAPLPDDEGLVFKVMRTKVVLDTPTRATLKIDLEGAWDIVTLYVTLDKDSPYLRLCFEWENTKKNHIMYANFELPENINEVFSEDMNSLIKRTFDSEYDIRQNLPKEKGIEVKNNTAPMQRGLLIDEEGNNIGVITKGLTQYEVFRNNLMIPILRSTGLISNPDNPARTTPAGPPIEVNDLQMIGYNKAEMYVFFGNENAFNDTLNQVYNYIIV